MPTITIQATDTLFFRDGKPFSMGDDTFAQGIFPPPPSVLYGALRSTYISQCLNNQEKSLDQAITHSEDLRIKSLSLNVKSDHYFPMPIDLIVPKSEKGPNYKIMPLILENSSDYSNAKTIKSLKSNYTAKTSNEPFLIELLSLEDYLRGNMDNLTVKKRSNFMTTESKIGIGREQYSHTVSEGKLYRVQSNRLAFNAGSDINHIRFTINFHGLEFQDNGWMALGGERKIASFEGEKGFEIECPEINSATFKIYLITPAVFQSGWEPKRIIEKYGLTLIAAAIDRPLPIGGWDMKNKMPKPMVQCVPAGAVFYVKAESVEKAKVVAKQIHGNSISDNINQTDYERQGFGIAYVGNIKNDI